MKRLWPLAVVPLLALGTALLVGALRRDALEPTPGEVVHDFLGRVVRDRYEKAALLLEESARRSATADLLREWKRNVESGLGPVRAVRGETEWISGEEAEATGVLVTRRRERRLRFTLEREDGRWRIARLDEFWGEEATPAAENFRIREGWRQGRKPRNTRRTVRSR